MDRAYGHGIPGTPTVGMPRAGNQGFSLIEVLVVIVILTIGIFSVVRLFPGGFFVNKQTEARTLAARLASQELNRFTATTAGLMDAVLPTVVEANGSSPTGYYIRVDLDTTPDDLSTPANVAPGVDPYYVSGINRIRWIRGETVRIPNPSPLGGGLRGSVYLLSSGPVYDYPGLDANNVPVDSIVVSGAPMIRRVQNDEDAPYLRSMAEYAIDYDSGAIAFYPAPYDRMFNISYSYYGPTGDIVTIATQQIGVAAAPYAVWQSVYAPGGRDIAPGSDTVSRQFRRVAFPPSFSSDPYEYALMPKTASIADFASIGVIVFNPNGADYVERSTYGYAPLTAKIDYNVLDWHIIREDRPLPGGAPYNVRLTLRDIKRVGEYESDQQKYTGIWRDPSAPHVGVLVYNVATGEEVPADQFVVNHREGAVTFSDAYGDMLRARTETPTFRFFYKAHGDWGAQIQKAAAAYRMSRGNTSNLAYGEFYLGGGSYKGERSRMYFSLMEAGKTVTIRELWYYSLNSQTGLVTLRRASNETYRINADPALFQSMGFGFLTWVDLLDNHNSATDRAVGWALDQPVEVVQGVRGISFKVRVVWNGGASVTRTGAGNVSTLRWRRNDLDTFLTRSPK
jgi:prepilin-type N-terminal cleavage/methylation domain-containing protein